MRGGCGVSIEQQSTSCWKIKLLHIASVLFMDVSGAFDDVSHE
jgi:hypothetical protein